MFSTEKPLARESKLIQLAKQDLSSARDNLARARLAARGRDVTAQWGQSGQTLAEIISGYEAWEREALAAVEQARSLVG